MSKVKKYSDFIKETDVIGYDEPIATKPTALSEGLCEKIKECMDIASAEAKAWHEDGDKTHTAESWTNECDTYLKECMESLREYCASFVGSDNSDRADGNMRQGGIQDVPVTSGAVR